MMGKSIFISGIDTDAGKTYCTAWYAMHLQQAGMRVITMKFIQTGCDGQSEDIVAHRRLMGSNLLEEDAVGLTAPIIFTYPASAQLAARIDGCEIDLRVVDEARLELERRYDIVMIEGAGGLMVPITDDFFAIDYASSRSLPIALVTSSKLGSINHTLLSLEAIRRRGITLQCLLYNSFYDSAQEISQDTRQFLSRYLMRNFPGVRMFDVPVLE